MLFYHVLWVDEIALCTFYSY